MTYYVKDLKTRKTIYKARTLEEAFEKLKDLGSGVIEIL